MQRITSTLASDDDDNLDRSVPLFFSLHDSDSIVLFRLDSLCGPRGYQFMALAWSIDICH